jgi:hypothetical protein
VLRPVVFAEQRERWVNVTGRRSTTRWSRHLSGLEDERSHYEHDQPGERYHSIEEGLRMAIFHPKVTGLDELRGRGEEFERGTGLNSVTTVHEDEP